MRELSQKKPGLEDEQQCQVGDESSLPVDPHVLLCAPFHRWVCAFAMLCRQARGGGSEIKSEIIPLI